MIVADRVCAAIKYNGLHTSTEVRVRRLISAAVRAVNWTEEDTSNGKPDYFAFFNIWVCVV